MYIICSERPTDKIDYILYADWLREYSPKMLAVSILYRNLRK